MNPKIRLPSPPHNPGLRDLVSGKRAWSRGVETGDLKKGFRGWYEKGYLPHRDEPGLVQFITFRLADAFPEALRSEWKAVMEIEDDRKRRMQLETYLDYGRGECHLRRPDVAGVVERVILRGNGVYCEIRAWAIMPNHVHVLAAVDETPLSHLVQKWKGVSAVEANKVLGRRGTFWQPDYWDTYMRDAEHEAKTVRYIENYPTKARLVKLPEDWRWSSARFRDKFHRLCIQMV